MEIKCLELYSGIGGMHLALKRSQIPYKVIAALDINNIANDVYRFNFTTTSCSNRIIETLTVDELTTIRQADLWTMSPPCQPFTRQGKQGFSKDERSQSFLHVIYLIKQVRPKYIFLENVKGFDGSDVWQMLLNSLLESNYEIHQYLFSPLQFGIPNCRLRYYLFACQTSDCQKRKNCEIIHFPPLNMPPLPNCNCPHCAGKTHDIVKCDGNFSEYVPFCQPLASFLLTEEHLSGSDNNDNPLINQLLLTEKQLYKGFRSMDIVTRNSPKSNCFTKGYGKKLDGAGSVLQTAADEMAKEQLDKLKSSCNPDDEATLNYARSLQLRHFHPREIANLMNFPNDFKFPSHVSIKQQYRLLGNSVNVLVIAHILHWHLKNKQEDSR